MGNRVAFACVIGAVVLGATARAQCPDGTPPPCGARVVVARRDPPLDARTWIVVPFDNLTRAADADWLREASANLVSLELSRAPGTPVVDYERVLDYLRQLPTTRGQTRLSYDGGAAVARRAGAGRLVMGDILTIGSKTRVTAKVFDVRTGKRVLIAFREAPAPDQIVRVFGELASELAAADRPDSSATAARSAELAAGTPRIDAYREYLAGVRELNRFEYPTARAHLERALQLDSTFALAQYELSNVARFQNAGSAEVTRLADAAVQNSARLPARLRSTMEAYRQFVRGDFPASCAIYQRLVRDDSSDVNALYGLGECNYHDATVVPASADSSQWKFRSNWNEALNAFRRILVIDPSYHIAFTHILDMLSADSRNGCPENATRATCNLAGTKFFSAVSRAGDTLVTVPYSTEAAASYYMTSRAAAIRAGTPRQNLEQARRIAEEWVAAAPDEPRAHIELGQVLVRLGRLGEAERELNAAGPTPLDRWRVLLLRYEIAAKRGAERTATAYLDTLMSSVAASARDRFELALIAGTSGRLSMFDSIVATDMASFPPTITAYYRQLPRVMLGVAGSDAVAAERAAPIALMQMVGGTNVSGLMSVMMAMGLRLPRTEWPKEILAIKEPRLAALPAVARRDTAAMRAALRTLDSAATMETADVIGPLVATDVAILLGDSASALERVRDVLDHRMPTIPFVAGNGLHGMLWARAMLLRADLAAGLGQRDEARLWYGRFLELWRGADPEFAPVVARIRAQLNR